MAEAAREFTRWGLHPPFPESRPGSAVFADATFDGIVEELRVPTEVASSGRALFTGNLPRRNRLWREFRNFMRQGISNAQTAQSSSNRSANLLHYYSLLNFAKAELLRVRPDDILGKRLHHGLSFDPTRASTIRGDGIKVLDKGLFPMLYQRRTGFRLPNGTILPIKRLLCHVPEVASQLVSTGLGQSNCVPVILLTVSDNSTAWTIIALFDSELEKHTGTWRDFERHYREVAPPSTSPHDWQDLFAVSRRSFLSVRFFESRELTPVGDGSEAVALAMHLAHQAACSKLGSYLVPEDSGIGDAWLVPSLYKTRKVPMPPSIARYLAMFYASSLVRYRPSMFDSQLFPEQAILFDSLARETAVPILRDTRAGLSDTDYLYLGSRAFRV